MKCKGFTLIEMMVTMVVAMVVLGGLMMNFVQQNSEYKYQGKRIDAVQDLEFTIKFIAEDLRSALMATTADVSITPDVGLDPYTARLGFTVWDDAAGTASNRMVRQYIYDGVGVLKYDRDDPPGTSAGAEILRNVTFFKIFNDSAGGRGNFTGIPSAQGTINLINPTLNGVSGYTILIEVEVDAGYKNGSFTDVRSNNVGITGHKRIWRYVQVYPRTSVN